MSEIAATDRTLAAAAWPVASQRPGLRELVLVAAGVVFITICAKINVPMYPVPMTMQTFAALVIGMAYGTRLGGATLLAYLGAGAAGLPVFAAGGGIAYFLGPTTGYLVGFLVSAVFVGWTAERGWDRSLVMTAAAMALGTLIIFALGIAWLSVFLGDPVAAFENGMKPFILGGAVKVALAALLMPSCWKLLERLGRF